MDASSSSPKEWTAEAITAKFPTLLGKNLEDEEIEIFSQESQIAEMRTMIEHEKDPKVKVALQAKLKIAETEYNRKVAEEGSEEFYESDFQTAHVDSPIPTEVPGTELKTYSRSDKKKLKLMQKQTEAVYQAKATQVLIEKETKIKTAALPEGTRQELENLKSRLTEIQKYLLSVGIETTKEETELLAGMNALSPKANLESFHFYIMGYRRGSASQVQNHISHLVKLSEALMTHDKSLNEHTKQIERNARDSLELVARIKSCASLYPPVITFPPSQAVETPLGQSSEESGRPLFPLSVYTKTFTSARPQMMTDSTTALSEPIAPSLPPDFLTSKGKEVAESAIWEIPTGPKIPLPLPKTDSLTLVPAKESSPPAPAFSKTASQPISLPGKINDYLKLLKISPNYFQQFPDEKKAADKFLEICEGQNPSFWMKIETAPASVGASRRSILSLLKQSI
ncbi:TPA_asm: protein 2 [Aponogeton virus 1]|uniref:Protein 2 n=1 Tax=Aponogeton virus 1 TaxID=2977952 RepID=A0A9N7AAM1_9RHAB|nr:TPA_asm: protein 2 [Aponogeton virus 1]